MKHIPDVKHTLFAIRAIGGPHANTALDDAASEKAKHGSTRAEYASRNAARAATLTPIGSAGSD
jgi:hypothetical protein